MASPGLTEVAYANCCALVDPYLMKPVWDSMPILEIARGEVWTRVRRAVYIVIDAAGEVAYVGSVDRVSQGGLCRRMFEHMSDPDKTHWARVMILPINPEMVDVDVLRLEGLVGRRLRPYGNQRLPAGRRVARR